MRHAAFLLLSVALVAPAPDKDAPAPITATLVLSDGSKLQGTIETAAVEVKTRYGPLTIPLADIRSISFASRLRPEDEATATAALKNLASPDFQTREKASATLEGLPVAAWRMVEKAVKHSDPEVSRRAERASLILAGKGVLRAQDAILTTDGSKYVGELTTGTIAFRSVLGSHTARLSDLDTLTISDPEGDAPAAPQSLKDYQNKGGGEYRFRVTGPVGGQHGAVWGESTYTLDSDLAAAAVHAGVLRPGQTATLRIKVTTPTSQVFTGSSRNGVTSQPFSNYLAGHYEFVPSK